MTSKKNRKGDGGGESLADKPWAGFIARMREGRGLSQAGLAQEINHKYGTKLDGTTVSKWENGGQEPTKYATTIARFFGVSLDALMHGEPDSSGGAKVDAEALLRLFSDRELSVLSNRTRGYIAGVIAEEGLEETEAKMILAQLIARKSRKSSRPKP